MTKINSETIQSRGMEMKQIMLDLATKGYTSPCNSDVPGSTVTDEVWAKAKAEELGARSTTNYMITPKNKTQGAVDLMGEQSDYCYNTASELDNIDLDDLSTEDIV